MGEMIARALAAAGATVRTGQRPGDVGEVIRLHGVLYSAEHGYDCSFEGYVARTFAAYSWPLDGRQRLWIVEKDGAVRGSIAIVAASAARAQLRWLLLHPSVRGRGLGRGLVDEALGFCRDSGYQSVLLWTEGSLEAATTLYRSFGFTRTETKTGPVWGATRTEERYDLSLA